MSWKKRSAWVSSALAVALLAGCGGGGAANPAPAAPGEAGDQAFESMELEVAVFQGGYGREYWDTIAESFMEQYPGTKVNITASPKIAEIVRPKIVAGNPPDFMYISGSDNTPILDGLIKDNALLDLTDVFNETVDGGEALKDKILPGVLESRSMAPYGDGNIYLAPFNFGVMGLWYNKTLFEEQGIEPPKTWDELFALESKATELNRALFTYQGLYPGYLEEIIVPTIFSVGGQDALDQFFEYDPAFWESEAFKQSWGVLERIASGDNTLMRGTVALNHTQAQTAFLQGEAMFVPNGTWFEDEMKDAPREDGFQFGFLGVPALKEGDPVMAMTNVEQMVIPAKAKNPELAKEFLKFLYSDTSVKLNAEKSKAVLAVKGAPDLAKEFLSETTYNVYKAVDGGMVAVNGAFQPIAKGSRYNPSDDVYKPISSIMNGQLSIEDYGSRLSTIYASILKELEAQGNQ